MTVVRYLGVPVDLFVELQEHRDALQREVHLASLGDDAPFPAEVVDAIVVGREALSAVRSSLVDQVERARAAGHAVVDLEARHGDDVDAVLTVVEAARTVEAAARDGRLLTMPPGPELQRFQDWWYEQLEGQMRGGGPQPFVAS